MMRGQDPYRPQPRIVARIQLPQRRLERNGADAATIDVWRVWWLGLSEAERIRAHDRLVALTDPQLSQLIGGLGSLSGAAPRQVDRFVENAPDARLAAGLAYVVESGRERPRPALLARLDEGR